MNPHPFPWLLSLIALVLSQARIGSTRPDQFYDTCANMFTCGAISGIGYPFRGIHHPPYCGHPGFALTCNNQKNATNINILNTNFRVLEIDQGTQTMRIAREDIVASDGTNCPTELTNTTLDYSIFDYAAAYTNYTFLYGCPDYSYFGMKNVTCGDNQGVYIVAGEHIPGNCSAGIIIPGPVDGGDGIGWSLNGTSLKEILPQGFLIRWKVGNQACSDCTASKGRCGYMNRTVCFCPDSSSYVADACPLDFGASTVPATTPSPPQDTSVAVARNHDPNIGRRNIVVSLAVAVLCGVALGWLIFFCLQLKKKRRLTSSSSTMGFITKDIPTDSPSTKGLALSIPSNSFSRSVFSHPSSTSDIGNGMSNLGVHVFDYIELERATNNFDPSRELGDGGFGTVYYGVLPDGRKVAVKRLYENSFKRVEQFMNEIEILTRLRQKNLVSLYGCTSRRSRELLLVYEYIPNGTVADHLHGKRAKSGLLHWPIRLNIAIETADALAYLHSSGIVHRDVKSSNILLDNEFHVKVGDFGLSRLFPSNATHVSTAPQGTPGYVDPEYYQCYQLTEKSDVYSFGVVLIELISSLQAVDTNRVRYNINLSNMAVNKIQNHRLHELVDSSLGFERNSEVRRTVSLVAELGFLCLQQEKDMRPSMQEVVESLRGIHNEKLNADKMEIVDMYQDEDVGLLKAPASPEPHSLADHSSG